MSINVDSKRQSVLDTLNHNHAYKTGNDRKERKNSIRASTKPHVSDKLVKKENLNSVEKTQVLYFAVIRCVIKEAFNQF
jgi:hypothetical protein